MHFVRINAVLISVILGLAATVALATSQRMKTEEVAMPDFRDYRAGAERKEEFFSFLRPLVEAQNRSVLENRRRLVRLSEKDDLNWFDRRWLAALAADYGVPVTDEEGNPAPDQDVIDQLLLRVDEVPVSLALAQAAKESGWGTSRFAREGYNLYGEWCFSEGCGIVPKSRAPGRSHEVEAFSSPAESVESYMKNINTHDSYKSFRNARKAQREADRDLSGVKLAEQLSQYSERREAYVKEVKNLIIANDLERPSEEAVPDRGGS